MATRGDGAQTLCTTCCFASANRCAFIVSDVDSAEEILIKAGTKYTISVKEYVMCTPHGEYLQHTTQIAVKKCPKYKRGQLSSIAKKEYVNSNARKYVTC